MFLKAESLKKAILEHPELPVVFFCNSEIWRNGEFDTWPADTVSARVGKILDIDWDTFGRTFTDEDEDDFIQHVRDSVWDENDIDQKAAEEIEKYKPHWKDCIIVDLGV